MSTDNTIVSTIEQIFGGVVQAVQTSNALLHAIVQEVKRRPRPFHADLTGNAQNAGGYATPRETKGVVRMIHNPTNADVLVTLSDGAGGPTKFNQIVAAASTQPVYIVFKAGLFSNAGAGCVAGGHYDP